MHNLTDALLNGPAHYTQRHNLSPFTSLVVVLVALFVEIVIAYLIVLLIYKAILNARRFFGYVLRRIGVDEPAAPQTFLELTFPASTSKSAFATEQQHILLRSLVKYYGFWDKMAAHKKPYSLELVGTRDDGIRYVLMLPTKDVDSVQRNLLSFLPGLKVKQVKDYMNSVKQTNVGVIELALNADFALPLKEHKAITEHDPIAYITGQMTKLADKELIVYQIVTVPVISATHSAVTRHARNLRHRIALNKELSSQLRQQSTLRRIIKIVFYPPLWLVMMAFKFVAGMFEVFFSSSHELPHYLKSDTDKRRTTDPYELELGTAIKAKLDQPLYEVTMRLLVTAPSTEFVQSRLEALITAFRPFASSYQSIGVSKSLPFFSHEDKLLSNFRKRTLASHLMSQQTILSSSELSDLYHFPETELTKTEDLVKSRSQELPAPLSIKRSNAKLDVTVGLNTHGGEAQPIGMTLEQRQKHTYVIGKTGTGKTTLLKSAIYQDMVNDKGVAVLDPHGDMFQELLGIIPKNRQKDVVIFDPSDRDFPIGLNILDPGIEFSNDDDKHEWITATVLSVFSKLTDEALWGPRMEHILRSTTMTALKIPDTSLYTVQRLLTDRKYQKEVANSLDDPVLKAFWLKEFSLMGTMQQASAIGPLTHRLGHFITTKMSRHILLQAKSTLRLADIMGEGKILLVNLSKGDIGEDQSFFLGTILTSFIWMAAYQRIKVPESKRPDFFVYVDEFQNFATPRFAEMFSEARKFHVSLTISHQNVAQVEDMHILKVVAGNAGTLISFRISPEDEAFMLPHMKPVVDKGDMVNLPPYHFYMKVTGQDSEDAFSGQTVPLEVEESDAVKAAVIANSQKQYGTPKKTVETYMEKLFDQPTATAKNPPKKSSGNKANGQDSAKVHGA